MVDQKRDGESEHTDADAPAEADYDADGTAETDGTAEPDGTAERDLAEPAAPQPTARTSPLAALLAGAVGALALLVVAAGAAWLSWPGWRDAQPFALRAEIAEPPEQRLAALEDETRSLREALDALPDPPPAIAGLEARLAALDGLEERVAALEAAPRPPSNGAEAAAVEALAEQVQSLERDLAAAPDPAAIETLGARLGEIEARVEAAVAERTSALQAETDAIEGRLEALAERARALEEETAQLRARTEGDARGEAVVLAAAQLREALAAGRPYAPELETLRRIAAAEPALAPHLAALEPHAETGVATREALVRRFDGVARGVARAARTPEGEGWVDRTLARLSGLVTIRRTGAGLDPQTPDGALARAEDALAAGDLAGAVAALEALEGEPAAAARPWIDDARARVAAERATAALTRDALAGLGEAGADQSSGEGSGE